MATATLDTKGFNELLAKLNKLNQDTKSIADDALNKAFEIVNGKLDSISSANYPAGGKFSHGDTEKSKQKTAKIKWKGTEGSVDVGYNIKHGGLPSIFMMYGTPKRMKVQEMYDAFYSDQTIGEVINAQTDIFNKAMEQLE